MMTPSATRSFVRTRVTAVPAVCASLMLAAALVVIAPAPTGAGPGATGLPGDPVPLHPSPVAQYDAEITPDGSRVVYFAPERSPDLFSVGFDGGPAVALNGPDQRPGRFLITADSATVVYSDHAGEATVELLAVPITGGAPLDLEVEQPLDAQEVEMRYQLTSDGATVLYMTDAITEGVLDLFAVPVTGGPSVQLNAGVDGPIWRVLSSSDSSTVVYSGSTGGSLGLFSGPVAGGEQTRLTDPAVTVGSIPREVEITPDSSRVIFMGSTTAGVTEVFSVPIAGGAVVKLNTPLVTDGDVHEFVISPDSSTVVYVADGEVNGQRDLYAVPIAGGEVLRLNAELITGGPVLQPEVTPDSEWVVYIADTNPNPKKYRGELFSVPIDGSSAPVMLNDPLGDRADVQDLWAMSADAGRVVYGVTDKDGVDKGMFSVPVDRSGPPVTLLSGRSPRHPLISPDSRSVVTEWEFDGRPAVVSVPIAGGTALTLTSLLDPDARITMVGITAHPSAVVFATDPLGDEIFSLFAVDIGFRCRGELATIVGTGGRDVLEGTSGPDVIHGLGGGDTIEGRGSADLICGGRGDDTINGGLGADAIYGNKGDDTIRGYKGADEIFGGKGKDTIFGGPGRDDISGGRRADTIRGGPGKDTLSGDRGDDELRGGPGTDTCDGGTGTNTLFSCETGD